MTRFYRTSLLSHRKNLLGEVRRWLCSRLSAFEGIAAIPSICSNRANEGLVFQRSFSEVSQIVEETTKIFGESRGFRWKQIESLGILRTSRRVNAN